ncbi:class F sortase [Kitasatospora sp. NPDC049285]|uniref:class F sortase n=1 Tax=Kitasatospora sp. NPDC049285 TaxID=3157096 RepID=UPI0034131C75
MRADRRPRRIRAAAATVAAAILCGAWLVDDGLTTSHPADPPRADGTPAAPAAPTASPHAPLAASPPRRIRIPSLKVDAPFTGLHLDEGGRLASPPATARNLAGWYQDGTAPGAAGTAVVVGHVDNRAGPAVFYRLGLLRKGLDVEITREDRATAVFTVDDVRSYPKDAFPDNEVYRSDGRPELRLITCGGQYSPHTGYQANTVVFAHLSAVR